MSHDELFGLGLYTAQEASRLSGVKAQRIRRWLSGYGYKAGDGGRFSPALWESQVGRIDDTLILGFSDLMEVRFVDRFIQYGISLHTVRLAFEKARELIRKPYPFSTRSFKTDGRTIFAEIEHDSGDSRLLDLIKDQFAFSSVISPSLYEDLDYSDQDDVLRWWPMGHGRKVLIDPSLAFGQPVLAECAIPTATLASAFAAEGSVEAVAAWFEVSKKAVKDAIEFEERMAA